MASTAVELSSVSMKMEGVMMVMSLSLSGEGGEPPGESVASLGNQCLLTDEVGFDFGDGWNDVFFEAVGIDADEW